jgi:hypothetical protein
MRTLYLAVAVCVALCGCATAYQKSGLTGGYTDRRLTDSTYYVDFAGNGYASGERVHMFFLYRCAELTLEKGFDYLLVESGPPPRASLDGPAASSHAMWYSDDDAGGMQPVYYYTYTITTYNARGTVHMYHAPLTYELAWAIDARRLKEELQPYVDSNGQARAPDLRQLDTKIGVTHEAIVYSRPEQIGIEPLDKADAGMELRTADEIVEAFRRSEIMLHVLFNARRGITGGYEGGRIDFAFTVTPNGIVSGAKVLSTTFKDDVFARAVAHELPKLTFKPRGAAMTRVSTFTVEFAPNF